MNPRTAFSKALESIWSEALCVLEDDYDSVGRNPPLALPSQCATMLITTYQSGRSRRPSSHRVRVPAETCLESATKAFDVALDLGVSYVRIAIYALDEDSWTFNWMAP
jgi:hypothetical protein